MVPHARHTCTPSFTCLLTPNPSHALRGTTDTTFASTAESSPAGDGKGKRNCVCGQSPASPQRRQGSWRVDVRLEWNRSGPDWKDVPGAPGTVRGWWPPSKSCCTSHTFLEASLRRVQAQGTLVRPTAQERCGHSVMHPRPGADVALSTETEATLACRDSPSNLLH